MLPIGTVTLSDSCENILALVMNGDEESARIVEVEYGEDGGLAEAQDVNNSANFVGLLMNLCERSEDSAGEEA